MTDIVERLRQRVDSADTTAAEAVMKKSADEIERLRALVNGGIHSEREARTEIERLRAALDNLRDELGELKEWIEGGCKQ